ncbi:MAG: TPM domain-containing protein [Elusimicrobia bacterium]|nr:TPM domain-containing protein [Elusimicrobiota bacterium]
MVNKFNRWSRHFFQTPGALRRRFTPQVLRSIEEAVRASEKKHGGEIRFVVEAKLPFPALRFGQTPRARAVELFGQFSVWDTEENNGVLIYVLLADRDVEIVADRGLNKKITAAEWEDVCRSMETHFREGQFEAGSLAGVKGVTALLARHFPANGKNPNELSDKPTLL